MTMSKPVPTPWRLMPGAPHQITNMDGDDPLFHVECNGFADGEAAATADHIVRCVNAHDELVALLSEASEYLADELEPEVGGNPSLPYLRARIATALAKVTTC